MKILLSRSVLDCALDRIRWVYSEFDDVMVNISGGKDSTVVLNLTLQVAEELGRLPVPVMFLDQEAEWQATIDSVRQTMDDERVDARWLQVPIRLFNATSPLSPWLNCWDPDAEWIRPKEPDSIHDNVYGTDRFAQMFTNYARVTWPDRPVAMISGVRAEESPARHLGLTTYPCYRHVTWGRASDKKRQHIAFYPIYDWGLPDVWKAIHEHGWPYCTTGETPIWMADYSFKRIDEVRPGDEVIGWSLAENDRQALRRTQVEHTSGRLAAVVKITLASGRTLRCTPDHHWAVKSWTNDDGVACGNWEYRPATVGAWLGEIVEPVERGSVDRASADWLAGIYDGEGSGERVSQSRTHNPEVYQRISDELTAIGIRHAEFDKGWRILGGRRAVARFMALCQPTRRSSVDDLLLSGRFRDADQVIAIEPDGYAPVYSLQTGTGNYVAGGYASRNCRLYDELYRYGIPPRRMRVSNIHHETAFRDLWILQEIEPRTWDAVTARLTGMNTAAQLNIGAMKPKTLPTMFASWEQYRDHLLYNLILDPEIRARMQRTFASNELLYRHDANAYADLIQTEISAILVNDYEGTKISQFHASHITQTINRSQKRGGSYAE